LNPAKFDIQQLAAQLSASAELRALFSSVSAGYSAEQLCHDQTATSQLIIKIEGPLSQILQENGLKFIRIAALNPVKIEAPPQMLTVSTNRLPSATAKKGFNIWLAACAAAIVILIIVTISFVSYRSSMSTTISKKDEEISSLQNKIAPAQEQFTALQTRMTEARDILNLSLSSVEAKEVSINQPGGQSSQVVSFQAKYAGYVVISGKSTSSNGLVNVTNQTADQKFTNPYTFYSDNEQTVPVLPGTVTVDFTNVNILNGATTTLTVVYHY
jgi:hypothetical protein